MYFPQKNEYETLHFINIQIIIYNINNKSQTIITTTTTRNDNSCKLKRFQLILLTTSVETTHSIHKM